MIVSGCTSTEIKNTNLKLKKILRDFEEKLNLRKILRKSHF